MQIPVRPSSALLPTDTADVSAVLGLVLVQLAVHCKANVFAITADSESRSWLLERCKLKSEQVYTTENRQILESVCDLTGGRGVDVVVSDRLDGIESLPTQCCSDFGKVIEIGRSDHLGQPEELGSRTSVSYTHLTLPTKRIV